MALITFHAGNSTMWARLHSYPSLLVFYNDLGLPPDVLMELCCAVGALLGLLVMMFQAMRCSFIFLLLWGLYLSVYRVREEGEGWREGGGRGKEGRVE